MFMFCVRYFCLCAALQCVFMVVCPGLFVVVSLWDEYRGFLCVAETCRHSRWGWEKKDSLSLCANG